jgi:hypothetical protein
MGVGGVNFAVVSTLFFFFKLKLIRHMSYVCSFEKNDSDSDFDDDLITAVENETTESFTSVAMPDE